MSIPYSYETNDAPHFQYRNGTIDEFEKMIRRQFDTLNAEGAQSGRVVAICLHPYLMGVPHRIAGLNSALQYIRSHDLIWCATGEEIVGAWLHGRDVLGHHEPSASARPNSAPPAKNKTSG